MKNFIHTSDKETADRLIALGFELMNSSNGSYTFQNKPSTNFNLLEQNGLNYVANNKLFL